MQHPVNATFNTSLKRSRLQLIILGFVMVPHMVKMMAWMIPWGFVAWWMTMSLLFTGRTNEKTYNYVLRYYLYHSRLGAWALLLTEGNPPFNGTDPYETTTLIEPPAGYRQSRMSVLLRGVLLIPSMLVCYGYAIGLMFALSFASLSVLFLGRISEGQWGFIARTHIYFARLGAYATLLTNKAPIYADTPPLDGPEPSELESSYSMAA